MMKATDKAWLAGFFDGEGTLNFTFKPHAGKTKLGAWTLRVRLCNTHEPTLAHAKQLIGAGRYWSAKPRTAQRRSVFGLDLHARSAEVFLSAILPHAVTKREQICIALKAANVRRTAPRILRGKGGGKGAPSISAETHARLRALSNNIKSLNGHKPLHG